MIIMVIKADACKINLIDGIIIKKDVSYTEYGYTIRD